MALIPPAQVATAGIIALAGTGLHLLESYDRYSGVVQRSYDSASSAFEAGRSIGRSIQNSLQSS